MAGITLFSLSQIPVVLWSYSKIIRTRKIEGLFHFHQIFSVIPKHRPFLPGSIGLFYLFLKAEILLLGAAT